MEPVLSRAPRERIGRDFVARFVRTSNFAVELFRADDSVIVVVFRLWFTISQWRISERFFIGNGARIDILNETVIMLFLSYIFTY